MKYWIYKITDKEEPLEFYIGSTNRFSSRKSQHKKNVYNKVGKKYRCKLYQYIRGKGGFDNFDMSIIEQGECNDRLFIRNKEQEYINELKPTLNSIRVIKL
jgi:hypothetical protein